MRSLFVVLLLANLALFGLSHGWFGQAPADRGREPGRMGNEIRPETIQVPQGLNTLQPTAPAAPAGTPAAAEPAAMAQQAAAPEAAGPAATPSTAAPAAAPGPPPAPITTPAPAPAPSAAAPEAAAPARPAPAAPADKPAHASVRACTEWGGFNDAEYIVARRWVREHLPNATIDVRHEAGKSNWMVVTPVSAEPQAVVTQLTRQGVKDLFVIRDSGPLQNAISLGLFSTEAGARRRVAELQVQGVQNLRVQPRPVPGSDRIWLHMQGVGVADREQLNSARLPFGRRAMRECQ